VLAVEGDPFAADDLRENAAPFGDRITVVKGAVEDLATNAAAGRADTVIVDPPRTGMSREALDAVLGLRAARIIYVSCDVATLARDARRILDAGHTLARADAFDLFPNSPHVETVVVFAR
jgi:23S rRNA (uracil1939-C5)-methyltransferase